LRKLGAAPPTKREPSVTPNQIVSNIFRTSNIKPTKIRKRSLREDLATRLNECPDSHPITNEVTTEEVTRAIGRLKCGKAAGMDGILPEFIKNLGEQACRWIADFFSQTLLTGNIPKSWRETKVIAVLKPGKTAQDPKNYRPIALLSVVYKLFEKVLANRMSSLVESQLPVEQAGFREGRSTCEQVLSLTTCIENGFQRGEKTGLVLLDLTAAYDTVWKTGLLAKTLDMIKSRSFIILLNNMLSNRKIRVFLGGKISGTRVLQNGLPQGSVLSPMLFNIYTADIPTTESRKFIYADDIAIVTQANRFEDLEPVLNADLRILEDYFKNWY
jgi:hypothetical protein